MMYSTAEIVDMGLECLVEKLGIINAEHFIATIKRERFDYTAWQREYFDAKTPEEISREASQYEQSHPFPGNAVRL